MANNKEAMALVVDIGAGMSEAAPGFDSPLQITSDVLQMIVQRKMFQQSKDELALILYGTDETNNDLADENNYQNINVAFSLSPANWHLFEEIQKIKPGNAPADLVDAIVVAADHLRRETEGKRGFVAKRVLLFTNAATPFNDHSLKIILESLRRQDIIVDAIGPTWGQQDDDNQHDENDRPDSPMHTSEHADNHEDTANNHPTTNGHHLNSPKKPLTQQQQTGIRIINDIVNTTEGSLFTFREALTILSVHQSKTVRPTPTKYIMQLADLKLHICTYIQVKDNKPGIFRLKKVYARQPTTEIKVDRGRYTKDEEDREIEKEELTDGFRYGTTFVPINKETLDDMKYHSEKCFSIIGFSDANMMRRSLYLGDTVYEVVAEPAYEEEGQVFAGIVQAMYDTNTVAIVRKCFSERSSPELGFLRPHIAHNHMCMYYVKLPFAEDLRGFDFDNLDVIKRNQPSDEQLKTIDKLITTMDLTHADRGEEAFQPEIVFNPYIQRMFQCIARRAVTPEEPLSLSNTIEEMNNTLIQSIVSKSKRTLDTVHEDFVLRETERRQKITTGDQLFGNDDHLTKKLRLEENENIEEPTTDSTSFEAQSAAKKKAAISTIGTITPVEDFKTLIEQGSPSFTDVCKQMSTIILELINNSRGDALFEKALQCIQSLREICIQKLEPKLFNDFQIVIKRQAANIDGRKDFWTKIVDEKISLITSDECIESNVIPIEAKKFLEEETANEMLNNALGTNEEDGDDEDLFDLI
ncbi:unnamed protein product [Rotaria magnacalcarata]